MAGYLEKVKEHFNSSITDYDWTYSNVIPKYDEMQKELVAAIPFPHDANLKMLELGVGTGRCAALVLDRFQNAHITGIDFSTEMLSQARKRFVSFGTRAELIKGEILATPFPRVYDVIFSFAVIDHLSDPDKKRLFKKIYEHLVDGGCFVNADMISFNTQVISEKMLNYDFDFMKTHLAGAELEKWLTHSLEDNHPTSLKLQFDWFKEIGFKEIQTTWIYETWAVYYAMK